MKLKTLITMLIIVLSYNSFAQTASLNPDKFGNQIFKIIQNDDYVKMTTLLQTSKDYTDLFNFTSFWGESSDAEKQKKIEDISGNKKELIAYSRKSLTKARKIANENGIILQNANFLTVNYSSIYLLGNEFANGQLKIIFEYLEMKYTIDVHAYFTPKNGWKLDKITKFNDISIDEEVEKEATEEAVTEEEYIEEEEGYVE